MDFEQARFNMVEQQIRPWEVLDQQVLDIMAALPREQFVDDAYKALAYADTEIPMAHGQLMMAPRIEARLAQALNIRISDNILEIGTGSGFLTAVLARAGRHVTSVDIHADFTTVAGQRLAALGITNVSLETGDALRGWDSNAPYDVIAVTGAVTDVDETLKEQMKIGGRMFVIVGQAPVMTAQLIVRLSEDDWSVEELFETLIPPLEGAEPEPEFTL